MLSFGRDDRQAAASVPKRAWNRRLIVPRIRLETFDAAATRWVLIVTYTTLAISIALTVVLRLGYDRQSLQLPGLTVCNGTDPAFPPAGQLAGAACYGVSPTGGANSTQWVGIVSGLSPLDGDLQLSASFVNPLSSAPDSTSFLYDVVVDAWEEVHGGAASAGGDGTWSLAAAVYNATATILCQDNLQARAVAADDDCGDDDRSGGATLVVSCNPVPIFDAAWVTFGQGGGGGYEAYRVVVNFHSFNVSSAGIIDPTGSLTSSSSGGDSKGGRLLLPGASDAVGSAPPVRAPAAPMPFAPLPALATDFPSLVLSSAVAGAAAGNVTYTLSFQQAAFRLSDVALRITLSLVTVGIIYAWLKAMTHQKAWMPGPPPPAASAGAGAAAAGTTGAAAGATVDSAEAGAAWHVARVYVSMWEWLPQQWWVFALLITTLLWQNPLYVALQLLPAAGSPYQLALTSAVMEFTGWASLFTFWWALVDGMKVPETTIRALDDKSRYPHVPRRRARLLLWLCPWCPCCAAACDDADDASPALYAGRGGSGSARRGGSGKSRRKAPGAGTPGGRSRGGVEASDASLTSTVSGGSGGYVAPPVAPMVVTYGGKWTAPDSATGSGISSTAAAAAAVPVGASSASLALSTGTGTDGVSTTALPATAPLTTIGKGYMVPAHLASRGRAGSAHHTASGNSHRRLISEDGTGDGVDLSAAGAAAIGGGGGSDFSGSGDRGGDVYALIEAVEEEDCNKYCSSCCCGCFRCCCYGCGCCLRLRRFMRALSGIFCDFACCCGRVVFRHPAAPLYGVRAYPSRGFAFYGPKLALFVFMTITGSMLQMLSQPDLLFGDRNGSANPLSTEEGSRQLLAAVIGLGIGYGVLMSVWLIAFLSSNVTTGRQLDRLPYAATRYQQLSYRFFIFQQTVVVLFVVVVNLLPLQTVLSTAFHHPIAPPSPPPANGPTPPAFASASAPITLGDTVAGAIALVARAASIMLTGGPSASVGAPSGGGGSGSTGTNGAASVEAQVASIVRSFSSSVTPIGELIIVSIYVYLLAYSYAPPTTPHPPGLIGKLPVEPTDKAPPATGAGGAPDTDAAGDAYRPLGSGTTIGGGATAVPRPVSTSRRVTSFGTLSAAGGGAGADAGGGATTLRDVVTALRPDKAAERIGTQLRTTIDNLVGLPDADRHRFALPTASWLFDFATAVYFDYIGTTSTGTGDYAAAGIDPATGLPVGFTPTASSYGPIQAPPHGFTLCGVAYDATTDTAAWVCRRDHRVVLAFRGTASAANVQTDLNFRQEEAIFETFVAAPTAATSSGGAAGRRGGAGAAASAAGAAGAASGGGSTAGAPAGSFADRIPGVRMALPQVHSGFKRAYLSVRPSVVAILRSALMEAGANCRLYATGHSLGGALAMLAAYDLHHLVTETREAIRAGERNGLLPVGRVTSSGIGSWLPSFRTMSSGNRAQQQQQQAAADFRSGFVTGSLAAPTIAAPSARRGDASAGVGAFAGIAGVRDATGLADDDDEDDATMKDLVHGKRYAAMVRPVSIARERTSMMQQPRDTSSSIRGLTSLLAGGSASGAGVSAFDARFTAAAPAGAGSRGGGGLGSVIGLTRAGSASARYKEPLLTAERSAAMYTDGGGVAMGSLNASAGAAGAAAARPLSDATTYSDAFDAPPALPLMASTSGGGPADESAVVAHMLLDDDVLEGADPLDCVGIPPDEDPHADAELTAPLPAAGGGAGGGSTLPLWLLPGGGGSAGTEASEGSDIVVYTFGSPRIGNVVFSNLYNRRIPYTFRIVFDGDVITSIPKLLWVYKHCGIEVWLDRWGNLIINPSVVERTFRAKARTSVVAHRMASYRRGLIHARRNEGLIQFRQWAAAHLMEMDEEEGWEEEDAAAADTAAGDTAHTAAPAVPAAPGNPFAR